MEIKQLTDIERCLLIKPVVLSAEAQSLSCVAAVLRFSECLANLVARCQTHIDKRT
jgi:hypothetical protein